MDAEKTNQTAFFDLRAVPDRSGVNRGVAKLRENSFEDNSVVDRRERKRVGNKTKLYPSWNPTAHEAGHMFGLGDEYRVNNCIDRYITPTGENKEFYCYKNPELRFVDDEGNLQTYNLSTQSHIERSGERYTVGRSSKGYYLADASGERLDRSLDGTVSAHYDLVKDYINENYANEHAVMHDGNGQKTDSIMKSGNTVEVQHYVTFADAMVQAIQKKFPSVPSPDAPNTRKDWTIA